MASEKAPETGSKALEPNLGTEMVKIYIGPKCKEFIIHKKLICKAADYFDRAFNGNFSPNEGIMNMPEDKPGAFSLFVDWLYRSKIPTGSNESYIVDIHHLWIFATKICLTKLADNIMDKIQDTCKKYDFFVSDELIREVWPLTARGAPIRDWVLDLKIHELFVNGEADDDNPSIFVFVKKGKFRDIYSWIKDDVDLFEMFMEKFHCMVQSGEKGMFDPRNRVKKDNRRCRYHGHEEENCVLTNAKKPPKMQRLRGVSIRSFDIEGVRKGFDKDKRMTLPR